MVDDIRADQAAYIQIRMAMQKIENRTEDGTLTHCSTKLKRFPSKLPGP
ncbi:MAG: hypothetical protein QOJ96_3497 [Alphaproteobacteria bacterium]|jgi:hypothetical protein|nr:hypothetical protein [Alphaproteobacteria bacterium]